MLLDVSLAGFGFLVVYYIHSQVDNPENRYEKTRLLTATLHQKAVSLFCFETLSRLLVPIEAECLRNETNADAGNISPY